MQADGTLSVVTKVNLHLRLHPPQEGLALVCAVSCMAGETGFVDDCIATFASLGRLGAALRLRGGPWPCVSSVGTGVALLRGEGKGHPSPPPSPHLPPEGGLLASCI